MIEFREFITYHPPHRKLTVRFSGVELVLTIDLRGQKRRSRAFFDELWWWTTLHDKDFSPGYGSMSIANVRIVKVREIVVG